MALKLPSFKLAKKEAADFLHSVTTQAIDAADDGYMSVQAGGATMSMDHAAMAVAAENDVVDSGNKKTSALQFGAFAGKIGGVLEAVQGIFSGQNKQQQFRTWFKIVGVSLTGLVVLMVADSYLASKAGSQANISGEMLMHSQRLAKAVPSAMEGKSIAFAQLKESRDTINRDFEILKNNSSGEAALKLEKLAQDWGNSDKNAQAVLERQDMLMNFGNTMQRFNDETPVMLELVEQIQALKLRNNVSNTEIAATGQLMMLTQRLGKSVNQFLSIEGISPETAFLLGKDANTFRDLMDAFNHGDSNLRIAESRDPEVKAKLQELANVFTNIQESSGLILSNLQSLIAAKQATKSIFEDNENLRSELTGLRDVYVDSSENRLWFRLPMVLCGLITLLGAAILSSLYLKESREVAQEAEQRRLEAEDRQLEVRRQNDANQAAILRLMNELQEVADGDLTQQATVSEDITGAIADSVNYTVEELRNLVGRVTNAAEQVTLASGQAEMISTELMIASQEQSREIRATGEAVLQMASQINEVSSNAAESANVARQSLQAAEEGQRAVQDAISGMNEIREQIQETSKRIKRLGESSQEIGEIIELISDITEQTNVLALNAAIQAASAGEAGRGFSVVAEEVQRLAERSGEATKQIGALVRTIQTDTQDAVSAMEKSTQGVVEGAKLSDAAGSALGEIGRVSKQLSELIETISRNTAEQAHSAGGVAQNIQHILEVTEQTTEGTQQTASSIRELTALAEQLKNSVARFRVA